MIICITRPVTTYNDDRFHFPVTRASLLVIRKQKHLTFRKLTRRNALIKFELFDRRQSSDSKQAILLLRLRWC